MAITDEIKTRLRNENPGIDIYLWHNPNLPEDTAVIARPLTEPEYKMLKARTQEGKEPAGAIDRLTVTLSILYPKGEELNAIIKRYPALVDIWSGKASELAGLVKGMLTEKL